jgi:hypothetical protein
MRLHPSGDGSIAYELGAHDKAILKLLADIRRLTCFPEPARREIGYTAPWTKR